MKNSLRAANMICDEFGIHRMGVKPLSEIATTIDREAVWLLEDALRDCLALFNVRADQLSPSEREARTKASIAITLSTGEVFGGSIQDAREARNALEMKGVAQK